MKNYGQEVPSFLTLYENKMPDREVGRQTRPDVVDFARETLVGLPASGLPLGNENFISLLVFHEVLKVTPLGRVNV